MASVQAFAQQLHFATVAKLTGDEHRRAFAAFARQQRDEIIARQRAQFGVPLVETRVDGHLGAALETVRLGGQIRFDFRYWQQVIKFALATLRELSPVDSGAYRENHFILINNRETLLADIPPSTREVVITNDQPYSRKIEVGAMNMSVPPAVYDQARRAIQSVYRNMVSVKREFIFLPRGGYRLRLRNKGTEMRYPALRIEARI